ncbi:choice-of-anchor J domain-containing protein [Geofilum rhodophaeum]|uniref:choice-of-anchor J domain-containing protein n=1 Tax=Geofilum rhodophaeum TaxID=1965019 RepID=UPI0013149E47|nr:choice-of-anchor J domain-containing protein [Geofilum rhodophaeum]
MRKTYFYFWGWMLLLLAGCEYNEEHFPELDELARPVDVRVLDYELTAEDYTEISGNADNVSLAKGQGLNAELEELGSRKMFSETLRASDFVPAFLNEKWYQLDEKSALKVTYKQAVDRPVFLDELSSAALYTVSAADYEAVWKGETYQYFTPSRPLERNADAILKGAFPEAASGDLVALAYNYSPQEPSDFVEKAVPSLDENFNTFAAYEDIQLNGWVNVAEAGTNVWNAREYSGNAYPQFSAYKAPGDAIAWLITPEIDLSEAVSPTFSFDITLAHFAGYLLEVLISEDFYGEDPTAATWTDITHHFAFYNAGGSYTDLYVAGVMDMSDYQANNFRVAFRYVGNGPDGATTTIQVDNVQIGPENTVTTNELFTENFDNGLEAWDNQTVQGSEVWEQSSYDGSSRAEYSAYRTDGPQEGWLVSPAVTVPNTGASQLLIDLVVGHQNAECLSVMLSEDYVDDVTTATWVDVTAEFKFPVQPSGYSLEVPVGAASLAAYKGKDIHIAFKYVGDGTDNKTTTYQIYDVKVVSYLRQAPAGSPALKSASLLESDNYALYSYNGVAWTAYEEAVMVNGSDYQQMGIPYFSEDAEPEAYLATYLALQQPYAAEEDKQAVVYFYGKADSLVANEYVLEEAIWKQVPDYKLVTDQFVRSNGKWIWNPSVVITLVPVRNDPTSVLYYQTATDWVWENVDQAAGVTEKGKGYVTSYGNNDYYTGASAYHNNVDWRIQAARNQHPDAYADMTDDEVEALLEERLISVMAEVLSILHPDAQPIEGVDITYTINLAIYSGNTVTDVTHSLVYKLVGPAEFEWQSGPDPIQ